VNRTLLVAIPVAALVLAIVLISLVLRTSPPTNGLAVQAATNTCSCSPYSDRIIMLHLSLGKIVTLNSEPLRFERLGDALAAIYGVRAEKVLYFSADNDVAFQDAAEVLDVVRNIRHLPSDHDVPIPTELRGLGSNMDMDIHVRLITPGAIAAHCMRGCYNWGKEGIPLEH
jgi:biopolymer transport protein ExbD